MSAFKQLDRLGEYSNFGRGRSPKGSRLRNHQTDGVDKLTNEDYGLLDPDFDVAEDEQEIIEQVRRDGSIGGDDTYGQRRKQ